MKKSLLLLLAAFATLAASAQTKVEIDGIWYNLITKGKVAEVTYKGSDCDEYSNEYSGSINLPATVTYEGVDCSVTSIGEFAFYDCSSLTDITLPESVTSIGRYAFSHCRSLTAITIPESVTSIGDCAFWNCSSLTDINIPEGVTIIDGSAFNGCSSLTTITIPEGVTIIGNWAFEDCSSLTAIVLPKNLNKIYTEAFANCSKLLDVYCYAEKVPSDYYSDAFNGSFPEYMTLHVPASALEAYKSTAPWNSFGNIVALTDEEMDVEQLTKDNSQLIIYDLCGQRIDRIEQGGIYIVNGKKTVIK